MKKNTIFRLFFICLLLMNFVSCQKIDEPNLTKPTNEQLINFVRNLPEFNNYLSINDKIQELIPSVIKAATDTQKLKFNTLRRNYGSTMAFIKEKNTENIEIISGILKPLDNLHAERLRIIQQIHNKTSVTYKVSLNEISLALFRISSTNARLASCASEAYIAAVQAYEYIITVYGDSDMAYYVADFVYSDAYRNCNDPVNGGGGYTVMA